MHEYPITQRIVEIASRQVTSPRTRVTAIHLVVGDDSGFIGESIQMYFDILAENTPCAGARLSIARVQPQLRCAACGALFVRKPFSFSCPHCGGDGVPTEIGKEFYVKTVELETEDDENAHD